MPKKGKLIVIYGINNLGKTTQAKLLVEKLNAENRKTEYLKYPIYDLSPSGYMLNDYLRNDNQDNLTPREFQILHVLNRTQYQPILEQKLNNGINIVAEDYIGTGIAWGIGAEVDKNFLVKINSHLIKEDVIILLDGERFTEAIEKNHYHETNDELMNKIRQTHLELAKDFSWHVVNANQSIEKVGDEIWDVVKSVIPPECFWEE
jgi:dTMP kinase